MQKFRVLLMLVVVTLIISCSSTLSDSTPPPYESVQALAAGELSLQPAIIRTVRGSRDVQPLENLYECDQQGSQNNWYKYLELFSDQQRYVGYTRYFVPPNVDRSTITGIQLQTNFLGPRPQEQVWRWHIRNWKTGRWILLGKNSGTSWLNWTYLAFDASGNPEDFIRSSNGEVRIRLSANKTFDNSDIDCESVVLSVDDSPTESGWWQPEKGLTWWLQLENTANLNTNLDVDVYDIDLFEGRETGKINQLLSKGYKVVCYFSAGTYEPWRSDAAQLFTNNGRAIIPDSNLPQFDEEQWLAIGDSYALENIIKPVMRKRMDLAKQSGCHGIDPDNIDGYSNSETRGQISYQDQLNYGKWLANEAHARGLAIGLKNNLEQASQLVDLYDFAVNEQCFAYGECSYYESTFLAQNKPVFNQEYRDPDYAEGSLSRTQFVYRACPYFRSKSIAALYKNGLNLNGSNVTTCY